MFEEVNISLHYSRRGPQVSWRWNRVGGLLAFVGLLAAMPAHAQYPGQIKKTDKDKESSVLRAVGVLEWTGEAGKPKTSRLIPLTVFDGERLQDAGIYLARPQPLAVQSGVEYILQRDGAKIGLFDIQTAGQEQGEWVGFGKWKALPNSPSAAPVTVAKVDDEYDDKPTLHRKAHASDTAGGSTSSASADPDRPTLHKKTSSDDSGSAGSGSTTEAGSGNPPSSDPDRPTLKKTKPKAPAAEEGYVESLPTVTDPNRPKLERGKSDGNMGPELTPTLVGLPENMEQTVAVSDPRNKPEHRWDYSWADPADELKMKADLEQIARTALGLTKPTAAAKPKPATATSKTKRTSPQAESTPLAGEQFRVFELAYGSGATLVLTAHTDDPPEKRKYVTLIAQPDLYGSVLVLFKSVTDAAHLDETPHMRLVDAVDAMADNRGELVFELRGETQRQFALYRVVRGAAERLFVSGGETFGSQAKN
jgi:hypothetical protein